MSIDFNYMKNLMAEAEAAKRSQHDGVTRNLEQLLTKPLTGDEKKAYDLLVDSLHPDVQAAVPVSGLRYGVPLRSRQAREIGMRLVTALLMRRLQKTASRNSSNESGWPVGSVNYLMGQLREAIQSAEKAMAHGYRDLAVVQLTSILHTAGSLLCLVAKAALMPAAEKAEEEA